MGGEVPREYYLKKSVPVPRESMESFNLSSGSKKKLEFDVVTTGSILKYFIVYYFSIYFNLL